MAFFRKHSDAERSRPVSTTLTTQEQGYRQYLKSFADSWPALPPGWLRANADRWQPLAARLSQGASGGSDQTVFLTNMVGIWQLLDLPGDFDDNRNHFFDNLVQAIGPSLETLREDFVAHAKPITEDERQLRIDAALAALRQRGG